MCGLVALFTKEKSGFLGYDKEELKNMLVLNSLRGIHSTGIAGVDSRHNGQVNVVKSIGSPYNLFSYDKTNTFLDRMVANFTTVIGHGRYATQGDINAHNAHPFIEDNITLAHNGVISNYFGLKDFKNHQHITVDSQLVAHLFAKEGAINVLPKLEGAYVFIWYDSNDNTFNIARNDKRPLFMAEQLERETMTFASEAQTLAWNRDRNSTKYKPIMEVATDRILTFHLDREDVIITPYQQKPPKVYSYENIPDKNKSTTKDKAKLNSITLNNSIAIGQAILFEVEDIDMSNHYTLVKGTNKMFPNIIFRASLDIKISEEDIYNCDFVEGIVRTIYPISAPVEADWQVFLGEAQLHVDTVEDDEEERVTLENFNSSTESMTKYRLRQLSKDGCAWCGGSITEDDLNNPHKLMVYDTTANECGIMCPHCVISARKIDNFH